MVSSSNSSPIDSTEGADAQPENVHFQDTVNSFTHNIRLTIVLILIFLGLTFAQRVLKTTSTPEDQPIAFPTPPVIDPSAIITILPRDDIPAIDNPQFEPSKLALTAIEPDERVIGLIINGDARAYPINILSSHEIVNDVVGGEPVAITWCPLCYSALAFSRQIEGQDEILTFGVSGKLLYNTLVMYDRQTETLWSQLYGAAVQGPLAGSTLSLFPILHTDWTHWNSQHPDGLVLSKQLTCAQFNCRSYSVDPYKSYYSSSDEGLIDKQIPRDEGAPERKKRVFGVLLDGYARAYPFEVLQYLSFINDRIGDVPVLIWFDTATESAVAYVRRAGQRVLTFKIDPTTPGILIDQETQSRWNAISGTAIDGPLQNSQLAGLIATTLFEFGWYSYFPDSDTYQP
jgi:hypothetical protein